MSMPELRFGIVGTGVIAAFHAKAIAAANGGRLVGVSSRTLSTAQQFAHEHGATLVARDVGELAASPEIDAICITTPSALHREPALAAIRAGKHLMIEKPIDSTVEGTDEILNEAARAGVRVGSIFQARFGLGSLALKSALDAGRFGRLALCSAYVKWNRAASYYTGWKGKLSEDGGGALINQAIHAVDLLQWFAGMPEEVFGWMTRRVHTSIESEDTCCATLRFPSGALGSIEASTAVWPGWSRRIEVCGESGSAVLEDDDIARWEFREARPEDDALRKTRESGAMGSGASSPTAIGFEGHLRQIQDFIDGIRERRPFAIEGTEARKAVALVTAIYQSASSGVVVRPNLARESASA
jgi:UDP-N-acetyl-2-amino-2-deoxyglucuronate dehydrogenase